MESSVFLGPLLSLLANYIAALIIVRLLAKIASKLAVAFILTCLFALSLFIGFLYFAPVEAIC
jgi:hypothetical protein